MAFVVFNQLTFFDFIGFYDPMTRLRSMGFVHDLEWHTCAYEGRRVTDDRGFSFEADRIGESLAGYHLVFVPGGFGTRDLQHDRSFIAWLQTARPADLKVSVCTGALLLGAAGFLQGLNATTHPSAYGELAPYCAKVVRERIVDEGGVVTAGGVTSSIDLGLHLVERIAGAEARTRIARQMDYPYRLSRSGAPFSQ